MGSEAKRKSLQEDLNQFSKNTMIATKQPAQLFFANLICSSYPMQFKSEWKTYRDSKVCVPFHSCDMCSNIPLLGPSSFSTADL